MKFTGTTLVLAIPMGLALKERYKAIGRVTWRLDGFASLDANLDDGVVETVPLYIPDGELEINADATDGMVWVEVLSSDGQVQPGFSIKDCTPLTGDCIRYPIRWKSGILANAEKPLRLRFTFNRAKLYAFRINKLSSSKKTN